MEERSFLHLQGKERGDLVAPNAFQRKLLPYEWGLIQALEISEQEYREIFQRIAEEQYKRSADYAHIPEIAAGPAVVHRFLSTCGYRLGADRRVNFAGTKAANPATRR